MLLGLSSEGFVVVVVSCGGGHADGVAREWLHDGAVESVG